MNVKIEFLEISPRIKYLKTNPSEIISISLHSGKNVSKIYDLEKAIKEQQKTNLTIHPNNIIKLSLIKNNSNIMGMAEFSPSNEIKWLNIKEYKNISSNENLLTISSQKMKSENIYRKSKEENAYDKNSNYYTTIKNNTIENNSSLKKYNTKSIINFPDACINNNIKIKISMKVINKTNKKISKKNSLHSPSVLSRGSSQIILNLPEHNHTINRQTKNKNISMSNISEKINQNVNIITDNSLRLKKKLKNAKSTSAIKLSINHIINNNKLSLNSIYTTINSNNKNKLKKNNEDKSLMDQKQKTQYNFNPKKSYLNEENEKNNIINSNYYNNTITFDTNNKKIEDLIIDNNFKNKLKSDEIINPNNSILKTAYQKSINTINPINREILHEIPSFGNTNTFNKEQNSYQSKTRKASSSINVPDDKYDFILFNGITKMNNYKDIILSSFLVSVEDNEFVKNFETIKNDVIKYYTKDYLNSINDDMLSLELKIIIEKILHLKFEYQKQNKFLFYNFINYKNNIKSIQKNHIDIMKKNNILQTKKINNLFINNNINIINIGNKQYLSSEKSIIDKNEIDIWNNSLKKKEATDNEDIKKNKFIDLFLFICEKNINCLNSLTKRYYFEIKKKKQNNKTEDIKDQCLSELSALITIQNINSNDKEENIDLLNSFNSKTIKADLKVKKFYENLKTTNKEDNKKKAKYNLFMNSKSTDKKSKKKKLYK